MVPGFVPPLSVMKTVFPVVEIGSVLFSSANGATRIRTVLVYTLVLSE